MPRYQIKKLHLTALERRLYPEARRKPYVVVDTLEQKLVGLPDRYTNASGAQDRADRMNAREENANAVEG